jgi:hypothetical protein
MVELGGQAPIAAKATVAEGEERERLYDAQVAKAPVFAENRAKTARVIPVVILERA